MRLDKNNKAPILTVDFETGNISLKGRSILENHQGFFSNFIEEINKYIQTPKAVTTVTIDLEYFDSRSSKVLILVLRSLEQIIESGKEVIINWYYDEDDEDIEDTISDYQQFLKIKITAIPL